MDKLDQLVTSKQDVVYNFSNWPALVGRSLVVVAVANTMELPERVVTASMESSGEIFPFLFHILEMNPCYAGIIRINILLHD